MLSLSPCVYPDCVELEGHPRCRTPQLLIFTFEFWLRWIITPSCLLLPCCCVLSGLEVFIYSHELGWTADSEMCPLSCTWQRLLHHLPLDCGFRWLKHTAFQGGDLSSSEPSTAIVENIKSHWHSTVKKCQMSGTWKKKVFVEKTKIKGGSKNKDSCLADLCEWPSCNSETRGWRIQNWWDICAWLQRSVRRGGCPERPPLWVVARVLFKGLSSCGVSHLLFESFWTHIYVRWCHVVILLYIYFGHSYLGSQEFVDGDTLL